MNINTHLFLKTTSSLVLDLTFTFRTRVLNQLKRYNNFDVYLAIG